MKSKIITPVKAVIIAGKLKKIGKTITLSGGCFDILHSGHILFLEKAKKQADILMILLESDAKIKKMKGNNRPINAQTDRALILSSIECVDYVITLPFYKSNLDYDKLISAIKPDIIATTKNDPARIHKERQAKNFNAKLIDVISRIENKSTSKIAKLLETEF